MEVKEFYAELDGLFKEKDPAKVEEFLQNTVRTTRPCCGKFDEIYVAATSELASFYRERGKVDYSIQYYEEVLSMLLRFAGSESMEYATTLTNLASAYRVKGDYAQAKHYYQEAAHVFESKGQTEHYLYSCILDNVAMLCISEGNYAEAEALMLKALEIVKKTADTEPEQAISYLNLATCAYQSRDLKKASDYLKIAMEFYKDHTDASHYLDAANLEAILMAENGQIREAVEKLYGLKSDIKAIYGENQNYQAISRTIEALEQRMEER